MAALELGTYAYVAYGDDPALFHERLVLAWVNEGEYVVMSPDADVFIEQLDAANPDLVALRFGTTDRALPHGLGNGAQI